MKEITQAVLDATYDKPLGRGLLRWRILELDGERAETKHIVELDNGNIAYLRKIANSALITDLDVLHEMADNGFVGLPECLGLEHVFLYSSRPEDPMALKMGMELRTQRLRKQGKFDAVCPEGFEADIVLTDDELAGLMKAAQTSENLRSAVADLGMGYSFLCRITSPLGGGIAIVDRDPEGGLALNCYNVNGSQDVIRILDGYDYLVSKAPYGYYHHVLPLPGEDDLAAYMRSKGYVVETTIYAISVTPQGESNVH